MSRDEAGKDDHEKELDHEVRQETNKGSGAIRVGGKGEHTHGFELEHKGEHWPHDHEKGPKR